MNNSVYKLGWPFYRYCVLLPQRNDFDLLEWLLISLIIYQNQIDNVDITNINESTLLKVQNLFKLYFSGIVDENLFENIKEQVLEKYVEKNEYGNKLDADIVNHLNSYENLFSDRLSIQYFFQDGITGKIFPHFYASNELEDIPGKESGKDIVKMKEFGCSQPHKEQIQRAYNEFLNISNLTDDKEYNVIILPNKKELIHYEVQIEISNDDIIYKSPFGSYSNQIMQECVLKAKNISEQVEEYLLQFDDIITPKKAEEVNMELERNDFASSLKYCSTLYRLIENLNDTDIKRFVKKIDNYLIEKDPLCYLNCGYYLEGMIEKIKYIPSDQFYRKNVNDYLLQKEMDKKFWKYHDKFRITTEVFRYWQNKYKRFQSDFMDILLKSNIMYCRNFYDGFISDVLNIYKTRSQVVAHYKPTMRDTTFDNSITPDTIDKLIKITKVIIEMI